MVEVVRSVLAIESTCDDSSVAVVSQLSDGRIVTQCMLTYTQGMHSRFGGVVPEYASRGHMQWLPRLISILGLERDGDAVVVMAERVRAYLMRSMVSDEIKSQGLRMVRGDSEIAERVSIDAICIASRPGLPGSIVCGVTVATMLGQLYQLPVVEVNHIMGHVFSSVLERQLDILTTPHLCLTVSGGHSDVYLVEKMKRKEQRGKKQALGTSTDDGVWHKRGHLSIGAAVQVGDYTVTKLVQTMDDAVGEAFDKVAKMLGGPYPGGPWIDAQARHYEQADSSLSSESLQLVRQRIRKVDVRDQFSFSGIKGQVNSLLDYYRREKRKEQRGKNKEERAENHDSRIAHHQGGDDMLLSEEERARVAWVFQDRVTTALVEKLEMMVASYAVQSVGIVGGVSANSMLQEKLAISDQLQPVKCYSPTTMAYCGDNAAMIGVVGLMEILLCL